MSIRPILYAVRDTEPIRRAIGNTSIHADDLVLANHQLEAEWNEDDIPDEIIEPIVPDMDDEFRALIDQIKRGSTNGIERGDWAELLLPIARHAGVLPDATPLNEDWKWVAWIEYAEAMQPHIDDDANTLLNHLANGRPLEGTSIQIDGTFYAWLSAVESIRLADALADAGFPATTNAPDLEDFHNDLIEALTAGREGGLILIAT